MPGHQPGSADEVTRTRDAGMSMLPAGTLLAGRYRIVDVAGVGGMGVVYRAHDEQLDTELAIKILRRDRELNEESLERFRREILLARKVSHPHVIRLHDLGQDGDLLFISMDYVPGQTLRERLADGPLSTDLAVAMTIQIAEALAVAHQQGIIHRDLKPGNILIDTAGDAHIMDFGVARSLQGQQLTRAGQLIGTPAYLAPEQVRGDKLDARADLFALGLVLLEALSGRQPDADSTLDELLGRRASGHMPELAGTIDNLPSWLARILKRCLAANPNDRYPDAESLIEDLRKERVRHRVTTRAWRLPVTLATIIAVAAGFFWWLTGPEQPLSDAPVLGPIAVLPLINATGQAHLDWTGRSLAENLSAGLAEAPGLQLVDNLRLLRLLDDLGWQTSVMDQRDQRRLIELLELQRLVSGRIYGLDDGFRIELNIVDPDLPDPIRVAREVSGTSPLTALPGLLDDVATALVRDPPTLPLAAVSTSDEALARYDRGLALISQGRMVDAIDPLRQAVELDPEFAAAWSRLAQALDGSGQYDDAVDSARTAVDLLGGRGGRTALEAQARLAALSGDLEGATGHLESLLEHYPADGDARLQLGENLISLGRLDAARDQLETLVELDPQRSRAWLLMGQVAILSGTLQQAADDYLVRALLIENRLGNDQRRGDILNAMGIARQRLGELDAAREHFEQAERLRSLAGDRRGVAGTRANLAHLALIQGQYDQARNHLAAALEAREALGDQLGMADLYNELGVIEEEVGNYRTALTHFREALRLRESLGQARDLADSYNNIAFANLMLGELDSGRQFNRAALERLDSESNPAGRIMALETLGYLNVAAGDWDGATRAFLEALELSRTIGQPWGEAVAQGGLGMIARFQGRYAAAHEAYQRAADMMTRLEDQRGSIVYQLRLAELELLGAQNAAAGDRLDRLHQGIESLSYLGHLADWYRLRGLLAWQTGQLDQARGHLDQSRIHAEQTGSTILVMQAALPRASLEPEGLPGDLLEQAERIGHGPLALEAIVLSAHGALRRGETEQAVRLARRGLRPPLAIQPWARNWELHWLSARIDSQRDRGLDLAYAELQDLLTAMPEHWHEDFFLQLPEELKHVEIRPAEIDE